jgi:hypothetical protein
MVWVDTRGLRARTRGKGKASHRGHGGHRGRLGLVDECTRVKIVGSRAEHAKGESIAQRSRRPQREIWVGVRNALGSRSLAHVREHAKGGKHRTEVTEATEGGFGLVDECTWVKIVGSRAGTRQRGKHRTEVTEATEEDWGWWPKCTWVKIVGSRAGTRQIGRHRTEVTEATRGGNSCLGRATPS